MRRRAGTSKYLLLDEKFNGAREARMIGIEVQLETEKLTCNFGISKMMDKVGKRRRW